MTSCATPVTATPSPRAEPRAGSIAASSAEPTTRRLAPAWRALACCALAGLASIVSAHEAGTPLVPELPGARLSAAVAIGHIESRSAWPAPRLPGVFGSGNTPGDRRGAHLEHGALALGLSASARFGAALALGWHDSDPAHVEAAYLQAQAMPDQTLWQLRAGRDRVSMGRLIDNGGHFDRFATVPLAKRAVIDDDWIDDGVVLRAEQDDHDAAFALETWQLGAWRARRFPGGDGAPVAPSLQAGVRLGPWQLDGFATGLRPTQRGTHTQGERTVHTHDTPDCRGNLVGVVCFGGRSEVLAASLSGPLPWGGQLQLAGLLRRDRGTLSTANGDASYRGRTGGGWVDLVWPLTPRLSMALRGETVHSVQTIEGASAVLVSQDAGLLGSTRIRRAALAGQFAFNDSWRLALEAGAEEHGSQRLEFAALRLLWTPAALWSSRW